MRTDRTSAERKTKYISKTVGDYRCRLKQPSNFYLQSKIFVYDVAQKTFCLQKPFPCGKRDAKTDFFT